MKTLLVIFNWTFRGCNVKPFTEFNINHHKSGNSGKISFHKTFDTALQIMEGPSTQMQDLVSNNYVYYHRKSWDSYELLSTFGSWKLICLKTCVEFSLNAAFLELSQNCMSWISISFETKAGLFSQLHQQYRLIPTLLWSFHWKC